MKFTKTLASVCAAAIAVSSLAVSAFADWKGANSDGNLIIDLAQVLPSTVKVEEVYGVRVNFSDASADVLAKGAGGGFIFSTKDKNWNQLQWCNGCDTSEKPEEHNIQLDTKTNSITRLEQTPFFTAEDVSGAEGTYGQIALSQWWGGDIAYKSIDFLGADGAVLGTLKYVPKIGMKKAQTSTSDAKFDVELGAQFDSSLGTIDEWAALPKTTFKADGTDVTLTYDFSNCLGPVKFGGNYVAFNTTLPWADYDNNKDLYNAKNVQIKSIKFDGVEYGDYSKLALNNEGGDALRITLMNEWNENFANGKAPLSGVQLPEFTTFEVTFAVTEATAQTPGEPSEPSDDPTVTPGETEDPAEPGISSGDVVNPGDCSGEPVNPPTGAAVAVIPALLAAAAVATTGVVLKKRSK